MNRFEQPLTGDGYPFGIRSETTAGQPASPPYRSLSRLRGVSPEQDAYGTLVLPRAASGTAVSGKRPALFIPYVQKPGSAYETVRAFSHT